jgi:hypothetical protein
MRALASALCIIFLVGCANKQTAQTPANVKQAIPLYSAIKTSMTRDAVYHSLGKPQKTGEEGTEEWRTAEGSQVAVLSLKFSPDGKVSKCDFHVDDAGAFVVGH